MGCIASKLDSEDTVRRCKERRRLMKDAVHARHQLAAAHSDYCRSLRITGSALTAFAAGEPLSISEQTPAVLLRAPSSLSRASGIPPPPPPPRTVPSPYLYQQPPPPQPQPPISPTIASSKLPHILSASSVEKSSCRYHRKPPPMKLPHILSDSSPSASPRSEIPNGSSRNYVPKYTWKANSSYCSSPSQASSVWNWHNFYPPSPPDSEFFNRGNNNNDEDKASSTYSNYNHNREKKHLNDEEEEKIEREEVQCSEWGDHEHDRYSTTSSSVVEDDGDLRSELGTQSNFAPSARKESMEKPPPATASQYTTMNKSEKPDDTNNAHRQDSRQIVVRHRDLAEIVAALKEYFEKAAAAGDQVSELLEISRAQMDRSFRQMKKIVYHSSGMFSNLSSSWTSKPPLAVKYKFEPGSIDQSGCNKSLCSTLERLLAWEKKLYQEIKARESVKIEHEKKLSILQRQEDSKLDKTKVAIKRLQSLIIVTSQAVSTTSTAIIGLRDGELVPQLVEICHGFMYMWRSMNQFHEIQNQIVQQVRGLINKSTKGGEEPTSDLHRQSTRDLESAVSSWHSSFCRLIRFQRDFIHSLDSWFKLTLLPIKTELTTTTTNNLSAFEFVDRWKLALDSVPDTVASEAIKSFINVIHSISLKQTEEMKIRKRTETTSKELEKRSSSLRNLERKYYHSYVGIGVPDIGHELGLDARDPLSEKRTELAGCQRKVEDEMLRYSKAIEITRAMTLNNLQTGLPGVFQAMTSFSGLSMEALAIACQRH